MLIAAPTRQRGVSLLEFMVAFTLVGILTAVAVPSFRDWIQNSQVRTAAESISNGITYARSEAIRRNTPARWRLINATGGGWQVDWFERDLAGNGTWQLVQARGATEATPNAAVTASQATVMFLGTGVVTPVPTTPIVIDVTNPTGGSCISQSGDGDVRCMRVTVSAAGQVRMCDPALAATAASGCRP